MKELLALTATALIVAAYTPYIRDILKGKTRPHPYTWFISGLVTFIAFGLQLDDNAGWGTIPTFVAAMAGFVVFILSLGRKRVPITKSDTFFFVTALLATGLWLVADQAILSVVIVSLVDLLAFIPTIRKSWKKPGQETVSTYFLNSLRFTLATLSVHQYNAVTILYPLSAGLTDLIFALYLLARRRSLKNQKAATLKFSKLRPVEAA